MTEVAQKVIKGSTGEQIKGTKAQTRQPGLQVDGESAYGDM